MLRYNSFEEMFKDYDISILSDKSMTKEELISVFRTIFIQKKKTRKSMVF
ncbi:MAG: hypothetical protein L6V91_02530 [Bacilli bacterium]|nr:MAG: hypothetical protein L6V91_02530 [Bacilli bacterium]